MKIGTVRVPAASVAVLVIQLLLVGSIAAKYLYQRWSCPRVWTRAAAFDPELVMRGRYLSVQLTVDGCSSTLSSARHAAFPRNYDGTVRDPHFAFIGPQFEYFPAKLSVKENNLIAIRIPEADVPSTGQTVMTRPGAPCNGMQLARPVNFYIAEHAQSPFPLPAGAELWIEVTVPPKGPPGPIQLALKQNGAWRPLAFQ